MCRIPGWHGLTSFIRLEEPIMKRRIKKLVKDLLKRLDDRLSGYKWRFSTFEQSAETVTARYNLYPGTEYHFVHDHANPRDLFYNQKRTDIVLLSNVTFWPYCSVVQDGHKTLLTDSAFSWETLRYFIERGSLVRGPVVEEKEPCASIQLGKFRNHYHWYVDSLPRLYGLHHPDLAKFEKIKLFLCEKLNGDAQELLEAMLPENTVIEYVPENRRIHAHRYIHLPSLTKDWEGFLPKDYLDFYRNRVFELPNVGQPLENAGERIYISRNAATKRRIVNETQVVRALSEFGFTCHSLESLSLKEQVRLFRTAKVIVGPHGAGLTNMIYSTRAKVLEMFSSNYPGRNHYRLLAAALNHEYGNLFFGKIYGSDELQIPWKLEYSAVVNNANIEVDVQKMIGKLEEMSAV